MNCLECIHLKKDCDYPVLAPGNRNIYCKMLDRKIGEAYPDSTRFLAGSDCPLFKIGQKFSQPREGEIEIISEPIVEMGRIVYQIKRKNNPALPYRLDHYYILIFCKAI